MPVLTRHAVDPELADEHAERFERLLRGAVDASSRNLQVLSEVVTDAWSYAGAASAAHHDDEKIRRALAAGGTAAAAIFGLASASPGSQVNVLLPGGEHAQFPATGPTDASHAAHWRHGYWMATIVRDRAALEALARTPAAVLRQSSTRADECVYLFVEALSAWQMRAPDLVDRLLTAVKATDPASLRISPEEFVLNVLVPEMEALYRLLVGEIEPFEKALTFGIERHRKYWGKGDRKRDPRGFIALGPLAIAAMAHDAGMPDTVESDYLPSALVRG